MPEIFVGGSNANWQNMKTYWARYLLWTIERNSILFYRINSYLVLFHADEKLWISFFVVSSNLQTAKNYIFAVFLTHSASHQSNQTILRLMRSFCLFISFDSSSIGVLCCHLNKQYMQNVASAHVKPSIWRLASLATSVTNAEWGEHLESGDEQNLLNVEEVKRSS